MKKQILLLFLFIQGIGFGNTITGSGPTWATPVGSLDTTVECNNVAGLFAALSLSPAATNACDATGTTLVKTTGPFVPGFCYSSGSYTNSWIAYDACGNASIPFIQIVVVQDIAAPLVTVNAADIVVECDGSGNTAALQQWLANHGGAIADDYCSNITWTNNFNAIPNDCSASVLVTFFITDACGNVATTSATFTVQDTTPPVVTALNGIANITLENTDTAGLLIAQSLSPTVADLCSQTSLQKSSGPLVPGTEPCANSGTYTNSWVASDDCGNVLVFTQVITVVCNPLDIKNTQENKFSLYPNPTHTILNLLLNNNKAIDRVIVTDIMGKTVIQQAQPNQINVESLASGMYILHAFSADEKVTAKFVKE